MNTHGGSIRKRTGGRTVAHRDRRKHELGSESTETVVDDERLKVETVRGGKKKVRALSTRDVLVSSDGETIHTTIDNVVENPANPNYIRRNIVTKGAIIETPEGRARVTSRPGQSGTVSAVQITE